MKIESDEKDVIELITEKLSDILPTGYKIESEDFKFETEHYFLIIGESELSNESGDRAIGKTFRIIKDGEAESQNLDIQGMFKIIESKIRLTIAEFAPDLVFLHAGVVEYLGRAIIIPGRSFSGKTSLVVELIKNGCRYLSDEYAIINRRGLVRSFPKDLSVRGIIDDYTQKEIPLAELGGQSFEKPLKPGWILIAKYRQRKKRFSIKRVTAGEGLLACLDNSISIRRQPKFVLGVLGKLADECVALQAERGEAADFSRKFLEYLAENNHNA